MGFNLERDQASSMESNAHRLEEALIELFPRDFAVASDTSLWPWQDPPDVSGPVNQTLLRHSCAGTLGFTARAHAASEVAQCGMAHWPPNVELDDECLVNNLEYDGYNLGGTDFQFLNGCAVWNPTVAIVPPATINCPSVEAWLCAGVPSSLAADKQRFHKWWMQNVPGSGNALEHCRTTTPLGNWWLYIRGDLVNPNEEAKPDWWCSPSAPAPQPMLGHVPTGSGVAGSMISLYVLDERGGLAPVFYGANQTTKDDGTFTLSALPLTVQGNTLVLCAVGGSFQDAVTLAHDALETPSLCSMLASIDVFQPLVSEITPFTDVAFHQAQYALSHGSMKSPGIAAAFYNSQISNQFGLFVESVSPFGLAPLDIARVRPLRLESQHAYSAHDWGAVYGIALAGLAR